MVIFAFSCKSPGLKVISPLSCKPRWSLVQKKTTFELKISLSSRLCPRSQGKTTIELKIDLIPADLGLYFQARSGSLWSVKLRMLDGSGSILLFRRRLSDYPLRHFHSQDPVHGGQAETGSGIAGSVHLRPGGCDFRYHWKLFFLCFSVSQETII